MDIPVRSDVLALCGGNRARRASEQLSFAMEPRDREERERKDGMRDGRA